MCWSMCICHHCKDFSLSSLNLSVKSFSPFLKESDPWTVPGWWHSVPHPTVWQLCSRRTTGACVTWLSHDQQISCSMYWHIVQYMCIDIGLLHGRYVYQSHDFHMTFVCRETQVWLAVRSLSTHTEDGEHMGVGHSLERTLQKWTGQLRMLHAGLPSLWWPLDWPDVFWFRFDSPNTQRLPFVLCMLLSPFSFFLFLSSPSPTSLPLPLLLTLLPFSLLPLFFPPSPLDHSLPFPFLPFLLPLTSTARSPMPLA